MNASNQEQPLWGSQDPFCPIRRMLAEEIIKERAEHWHVASEADRDWAMAEALKVQRGHEKLARSTFDEKG